MSASFTPPSTPDSRPSPSPAVTVLLVVAGLAVVVGVSAWRMLDRWGALGYAVAAGSILLTVVSILGGLWVARCERRALLREGADRVEELRSIWRAIGVAFLVVLGGLLSFEAVDRWRAPFGSLLVAPGDSLTGYNCRDPLLGWSGRPGARAVDPRVKLDVVLNSDGYADREFDPDRRGRPRILLFGDSVAMSYGVTFADSMVEQLRARLPAAAQVVGRGWQGYHLDQIALAYTERHRRLAADIVVCVYQRRVSPLPSEPAHFGLAKPWFLPTTEGFRRVGPAATVRTVVDVERIQAAADRLRFEAPGRASFAVDWLLTRCLPERTALGRRLFQAYETRRLRAAIEPPGDAQLDRVLRIARAVEEDGGRCLLVPVPSRLILERPRPAEAFAPVLEAFRAAGIETLDVVAVLLGPNGPRYTPDQHPDADGYRRIAAQIVDRIGSN